MDLIQKIVNWYFSKNALPYWCILVMDCTIVVIAGLISYYCINGGYLFVHNFWLLTQGLILSLLFYAIFFRLFHTYQGIIRYSSFVDLQRVAFANLSASVFIYIFHVIEDHIFNIEGLVTPGIFEICMMVILGTTLMWVFRVLVKVCYDTLRCSKSTQHVFIYGCLQGGIAIGKCIRNSTDSRYNVAGYITTDDKVAQSWMMGVKVYLDTDEIVKTMQKKGATVLIVSPIQNQHFCKRTTLIDALIKAKIKILMVPKTEEWDGKSDINSNQLKEIDIEDLLPRDQIQVDMEAIGKQLCGKKILITGAAGSIGCEIVRQVAKFNPAEMILVDQAETPMHDVRLMMKRQYPNVVAYTIVTSICRRERMEELYAEHKPEYVFHAAAYKHVPMMEDNPKEAILNNVYGTRVIADLAVKYGTKKFVMISTDKAVNPTNVMGCSKRICEIYCQSLNDALKEFRENGTCDESIRHNLLQENGEPGITQYITTRFGNVLGSNGSVIPLFRHQMKDGGPLTVTHPDISRFFMLIPEACKLVLEAATFGQGGEIMSFDMGEPVRIVDLAQRMIDLSGATNVSIAYTGLREGEKLYEEVVNDKETSRPTPHPKIMVNEVRKYHYVLALKNEEELYELSFSHNDMEIVKKMKEIVPEYISQNSRYSVLDQATDHLRS